MYSQEVQSWLDRGCPFLPGVRLYQLIGGPYPISIFLGFEQAGFVPADVQQRLNQGLRAYLQKYPITPDTKAPKEKLQVIKIVKIKGTEPEAITDLRAKAKNLHKLHSHLKAQLSTVGNDSDRYNIADQIMQKIIPGLDRIYDQIRHWEKTGNLPALLEQHLIDNPRAIANRINTLASRISKLRRFLKGDLVDKKRAKYEKELLAKEIELAKLKE